MNYLEQLEELFKASSNENKYTILAEVKSVMGELGLLELSEQSLSAETPAINESC